MAEKLRQQKIVEEADLEIAAETFGVANKALKGDTIDSFIPANKEDYDKFSEMLITKVVQFDKSPFYAGFLEILFRDLSVSKYQLLFDNNITSFI